MMAASGKRVDIHLDGSEAPAKTWFIGTPTQSHTGTHMHIASMITGLRDSRHPGHWHTIHEDNPLVTLNNFCKILLHDDVLLLIFSKYFKHRTEVRIRVR